MSTTPQKTVEVVPNPKPDRPYLIRLICPEFTCLCPKTGQPDFATIHIRYVPGPSLVELKSLKLYLWSFRNEGCYHEAVTNQILDYLSTELKPLYMEVIADFSVRGGIHTLVETRTGALPAGIPAPGPVPRRDDYGVLASSPA